MKLRTALRLGRVSNLPTVCSNVIAGASLAGVGLDPRLLGWVALAMSSMYVGGMYLNDAFDREYDRRERAERPIPKGEVRASTVFAIGFALLGAGAAIIAWLTVVAPVPRFEPVLWALALAGLIVLYDAYHKQNPLSPLLMALTRVAVYVIAARTVSPAMSQRLPFACAVLLCYLIGLTYAAKQENLREPRGMWPLVLIELPFIAYAFAFRSELGMLQLAPLFAWVAYCLVFLVHPKKRNVKRAIGFMIAGISLLDAMVAGNQSLPLAALFCVLLFVLTLIAQRFIPGT